MTELLNLFITFVKIGIFTFGGGYAMLPFIEKEALQKHNWITKNELVDIIALDSITPGPIAVNFATFVGYKVKGLTGALVATVGVVLPALIIVAVIAATYFAFQTNKYVQALTKGLQPAVVGLIAVTIFYLIKEKAIPDYKALFIALGVFIAITVFNFNPFILIIISAMLGFVFYL